MNDAQRNAPSIANRITGTQCPAQCTDGRTDGLTEKVVTNMDNVAVSNARGRIPIKLIQAICEHVGIEASDVTRIEFDAGFGAQVSRIQRGPGGHVVLDGPDSIAVEVLDFDIDWNPPTVEVTHACPPEGSGVTPCCDRTPFELPMTDRMTLDPALVTCQVAASEHREAV